MFNSYAVGTTAAVGLFAVIALAFAVSVDFQPVIGRCPE